MLLKENSFRTSEMNIKALRMSSDAASVLTFPSPFLYMRCSKARQSRELAKNEGTCFKQEENVFFSVRTLIVCAAAVYWARVETNYSQLLTFLCVCSLNSTTWCSVNPEPRHGLQIAVYFTVQLQIAL